MAYQMKAAVAALLALAFAVEAQAEKWLKIMPNDPYATEGSYHLFDIDSAFEDRATGFVAARMTFVKPETTSRVPGWNVWAFDCQGSVYYVAAQNAEQGLRVEAGWRSAPVKLDTPQMGGVTNVFGEKLCALKGSWPKGDLPVASK